MAEPNARVPQNRWHLFESSRATSQICVRSQLRTQGSRRWMRSSEPMPVASLRTDVRTTGARNCTFLGRVKNRIAGTRSRPPKGRCVRHPDPPAGRLLQSYNHIILRSIEQCRASQPAASHIQTRPNVKARFRLTWPLRKNSLGEASTSLPSELRNQQIHSFDHE